MKRIYCRACNACGLYEVLNLGRQPPSNALLDHYTQKDHWYPLRLVVCRECWLLQLDYDVSPLDLFNDKYPYFSGQSKQWVEHCKQYSQMIYKRLGLSKDSVVFEIGGNDGTLLKNFLRPPSSGGGKASASEQPVFMVANYEPSENVADAARKNGVPTVTKAWGWGVAQVPDTPDLIIANNVMAHTPDLNGFIGTVAKYLAPGGTFTAEFPWALNLIEQCQFDTIYHEHYSYLSLNALIAIFFTHGLRIYDVEELPTHGGSLRIYVSHVGQRELTKNVVDFLARESKLTQLETYVDFRKRAYKVRSAFEAFLNNTLDGTTTLCAYGAAAKGNTFLNWMGLGIREIHAVGDTTPAKIGKYLPGSHIPVLAEPDLLALEPDAIIILPWNWTDEIVTRLRQLGYTGNFVTAIPELKVF